MNESFECSPQSQQVVWGENSPSELLRFSSRAGRRLHGDGNEGAEADGAAEVGQAGKRYREDESAEQAAVAGPDSGSKRARRGSGDGVSAATSPAGGAGTGAEAAAAAPASAPASASASASGNAHLLSMLQEMQEVLDTSSAPVAPAPVVPPVMCVPTSSGSGGWSVASASGGAGSAGAATASAAAAPPPSYTVTLHQPAPAVQPLAAMSSSHSSSVVSGAGGAANVISSSVQSMQSMQPRPPSSSAASSARPQHQQIPPRAMGASAPLPAMQQTGGTVAAVARPPAVMAVAARSVQHVGMPQPSALQAAPRVAASSSQQLNASAFGRPAGPAAPAAARPMSQTVMPKSGSLGQVNPANKLSAPAPARAPTPTPVPAASVPAADDAAMWAAMDAAFAASEAAAAAAEAEQLARRAADAPRVVGTACLADDLVLKLLGAMGDPDVYSTASAQPGAPFSAPPVFLRGVVTAVTADVPIPQPTSTEAKHGSGGSGRNSATSQLQRLMSVRVLLQTNDSGKAAAAATAVSTSAPSRFAEVTVVVRGTWLRCRAEPGDVIHVVSSRAGQLQFPPAGPQLQPLQRTAGNDARVQLLMAGVLLADLPPLPLTFNDTAVVMVDDTVNILIVHPDVLLPPTRIADGYTCLRRAILQELLGDAGAEDNNALVPLLGSLKHQMFETALMTVSSQLTAAASSGTAIDIFPCIEQLQELLQGVVDAMVRDPDCLERLYACDRTGGDEAGNIVATTAAELRGVIPGICDWLCMHALQTPVAAPAVPGSAFSARPAANQQQPAISFKVSAVVAVEDAIWSPVLGIKGVVDSTLDVAIRGGGRQGGPGAQLVKRLPFELKTGRRPRGGQSSEHRAQMLVYSLIMQERYQAALIAERGAAAVSTGGRVSPYPGAATGSGPSAAVSSAGGAVTDVGGLLVYLSSSGEQSAARSSATSTGAASAASAASSAASTALHYTDTVSAEWREQRDLIAMRNDMAVDLTRARRAALQPASAPATTILLPATSDGQLVALAAPAPPPLPPLLEDEKVCRRCFVFAACAIMHAVRHEGGRDRCGSSSSSAGGSGGAASLPAQQPTDIEELQPAIAAMYHHATAHLTPAYRAYFYRWLRLVDLEAAAAVPAAGRRAKRLRGNGGTSTGAGADADKAGASGVAVRGTSSGVSAGGAAVATDEEGLTSLTQVEEPAAAAATAGISHARASLWRHTASQRESEGEALGQMVLIAQRSVTTPRAGAPQPPVQAGAATDAKGAASAAASVDTAATVPLGATVSTADDNDEVSLTQPVAVLDAEESSERDAVPTPGSAADAYSSKFEYVFCTLEAWKAGYSIQHANSAANRSRPSSPVLGAAAAVPLPLPPHGGRSLLETDMGPGEWIVCSGQDRGPFGIITGTVTGVDRDCLIIRGTRDVRAAFPTAFAAARDAVQPWLWRIDKDEMARSIRQVKDNLVRMFMGRTVPWPGDELVESGAGAGQASSSGAAHFAATSAEAKADSSGSGGTASTSVNQGDIKRQRLIVDLAAPRFTPAPVFPWDAAAAELDPAALPFLPIGPPYFPRVSPTSDEALQLKKEYYELLNDDQRAAIARILCAKDYTCLLGLPGSGKTSTVSFLVRCMVALGRSVVITSHTHSAVDTLLLKLVDAGMPVLRIGNSASIHPRIRPLCLQSLWSAGEATTGEPLSVAALHYRLQHTQVVGVTCLGVRHVLFSQRRFDLCVVDEAGQLPEPFSLGPLRTAAAFLLVGDHNQLPPLVVSPTAAAGGMGVSLLKRLCDAHPAAVVPLTTQFRMNKDIQLLSNTLIYDHALKCGTEGVANGRYLLPRLDRLPLPVRASSSNSSSGGSGGSGASQDWLRAVLTPSATVLWLDTDTLAGGAARESEERATGSSSSAAVRAGGGASSGGGGMLVNRAEAALVSLLTAGVLLAGGQARDVGIISPYRAQLRLLRRVVDDRCRAVLSNSGDAAMADASSSTGAAAADVEVDTVDRFQGRDKPVILISMVRCNAAGELGMLLQDVRRLNVAFSRAKYKLVLVGSRSTMAAGSQPLKQLAELIAAQGWMLPLPQDALSTYAPPLAGEV